MNIAMFGHKRIPSREGGVEVVVEELAVRMAAKGHSVTCYNRGGHHISGAEYDGANLGQYHGVRIQTVPTWDKRGLAAVTSSFSAALACAFGKYDVAHIHSEGPAVMCRIAKLNGKKVVVTIHGLDYKRAKWGKFAAKYIKWGEEQAVKCADEIIVLSQSMRDYFLKEYGRETVLIPNGVTKPTVREAKRIHEEWGLTKDAYVLFLGRIVPEKGLSYLIEAWKGVRSDKKLVVAGGSSDTEEFVAEMRKAAGDNVIFTGFQQGRTLEELYSNAYLYCLPSDLEGMPLSLLEAMSYGNCCVVSDIPECAEVVEDKAVMFPKGNVMELRRVLQRLLDNEAEVESYRRIAADYITEKYNWDDVTNETIEVYAR